MVAESATQSTPPTASANRGIASTSDVDLLRDLDRVIDLDAEIANSALYLGMTD